jgi:hypothetical protein
MKMFLLPVVFICLAFHAAADLLPGKVQISVQKKKGEEKATPGEEGGTARAADKQSYTITLQNRTSADLAELTVDYVMFVERQKLGEKKGSEMVERVPGTAKLGALSKKPETVTTGEVTLKASNVVGNYIYSNGGRIKAEDSLIGIWVRVSQGGTIIGEYALPSTLINRGWDKDKK